MNSPYASRISDYLGGSMGCWRPQANPGLYRRANPAVLARSGAGSAATLRSAHGVPCQLKATCNSGGPGHHWVKSWVIDCRPYKTTIDPEQGSVIRTQKPCKTRAYWGLTDELVEPNPA